MERRGRGGVDNTLAAGIRSRVRIRCSAAKFFPLERRFPPHGSGQRELYSGLFVAETWP